MPATCGRGPCPRLVGGGHAGDLWEGAMPATVRPHGGLPQWHPTLASHSGLLQIDKTRELAQRLALDVGHSRIGRRIAGHK